MIDGSVLQSAQKCFEKKSRVVVKMVVIGINEVHSPTRDFRESIEIRTRWYSQTSFNHKTVY